MIYNSGAGLLRVPLRGGNQNRGSQKCETASSVVEGDKVLPVLFRRPGD